MACLRFWALSFASMWVVSLAHADVRVVIDAAGRTVGFFDGFCTDAFALPVISRTGYYACVGEGSGQIKSDPSPPGSEGVIGSALFASADCSGQEYAAGLTYGGFVLTDAIGRVLMSPRINPTEEPLVVVVSYLDSNGNCQQPGASPADAVIPVFPNDPAVTGFFYSSYSPDLSVVVRPEISVDDEIWFDDFE